MFCTGPIKYSYINGCGNLVFVYENNCVNTVGYVLGPTGSTGVTGSTGTTGPTGNGIKYLYLDDCNEIVAVMTGLYTNWGNWINQMD